MTSVALESGSVKGQAARTVVVLLGPSLGALTSLALVPAMPAIAAHFGTAGSGEMFAKMMTATPALTCLLGAPAVGWAAEQFGERRCLLLSYLIFTLAGMAGLIISDPTILMVSRGVLGLGSAGIMTLSSAMIAEYYAGNMRERLYGFSSSLAAVTSILLMVVGGRLVDWAGWRAPFGFYLAGLAMFAIAWPATKASQTAGIKGRPNIHTQGSAGALWGLWPLYLLLVIFAIGMFMPLIQGPFLLGSVGVKRAALVGEFIAVSIIASIPASASFGFLSRALGERNILVLVAAFLGGGAVILALSTDNVSLAVGFAVSGLGAGLLVPALTAMILSRAPAAVRGPAAGFIFTAIFLGQFVTPLVSHPLELGFGLKDAFIVIGIGIGLAGLAGYAPSVTRRSASG